MEPASTPLSPDEKSLITAALEGDAARVSELLAKGVRVDPRECETHPLGLEWNITPLMCAAARGHLDVVRLLLDAGADVSAASDAHKQDGGPGSQALHHALLGNHVSVAELLLDRGADPNAIGRYGRTPLTCAVSQMSLEGVGLMLSRGADVDLKTRRKDVAPPLHAAVSAITATTSMKIVAGKMVMEVEAVWARRSDIMEIFRLLIDAGADPNATGPRNSTALKDLAFCRQMPDDLRFPLVELLMRAGAHPDLPDKDGGTALGAAKLFKNAALLDLLSRPVPERTTPPAAAPTVPPPAAAKKASKTKSTNAAAAAAALGAAHFHQLIATGEAEWAVLAIKAPIDPVADALARLLNSATISRNVPIKPAAKPTDEIAPAIAVVQIRDNPWTIVYHSLFHADEAILGQADQSARRLSEQLKTRAIVYAGHSASDAGAISVFENGTSTDDVLEEADEDAADQFFRDQGAYLPACYPKANGKTAWVAAEKQSAKRIGRGDLILLPEG